MLKRKLLVVAMGMQHGKQADSDATSLARKIVSAFPRHKGHRTLSTIAKGGVEFFAMAGEEKPPEPVLYFEDKSVALGALTKTDFGWRSEEVEFGFTIPKDAVFFIAPAIK